MSESVIPPFRNMPLVMGDVPTQVSAEFFEQVARLLEELQASVETLQVASGSGTPEGSLTAGLEKLYRDTVTDNVYIKTTATGNTGWVQI